MGSVKMPSEVDPENRAGGEVMLVVEGLRS